MKTQTEILKLIRDHRITSSDGLEVLKLLRQKRTTAIVNPSEQGVLFLHPSWERSDLTTDSSNGQWSRRLVVLGLEQEVPQHVLECSGVDQSNVVWARPAERYRKRDGQTYDIDPKNPEDYRQLLSELQGSSSAGIDILHAWTMAPLPPAPDDLDQQLQYGVFSLLHLIQAITSQRLQDTTRVLCVYPTADGDAVPVYAAVSGFAKSVRVEEPTLVLKTVEAVGCLDIGMLLSELRATSGSDADDVRHDGRQRLVRRFRAAALEQPECVELKQGGSYLITGGVGGLGLLLAQHLAQKVKARLALVGRSALDPAKARAIDRIREAGSEVAYIRADVSRPDDVRSLIATVVEQFGEINGVIHAAGVIRDSFARLKTAQELDAVIAPKVHGSLNLDQFTRGQPLDFFIMFSSTAGILGNVGQCDYAYANSFMDHFAWSRESLRKRQQRNGRTLTFNWSLWQDGGMRVSSEQLARILEDTGIAPLPTSLGIDAFLRCLQCGTESPQWVVLYGDRAKCEQLFVPAKAAERASEVRCVSPRKQEADTAELSARTEAYLREIIAEGTRIPLGRIEATVNFENYGIDSIIIGRFNARIERDFERLPKTLLFEYRNLRDVARYLVKNHYQRVVRMFSAGETNHAREVIARRRFGPEVNKGVTEQTDGIAIIGLSGCYPQAADVEEFWNNLKSGMDCITPIPAERWDWRVYHDPNPRRAREGKIYCRWGGFLANVDKFDPILFGIAPTEAERMDPQERLFLKAVWCALEDAGYTRKALSRTRDGDKVRRVGVFVGVTSSTYQVLGVEERLRGNLVFPDSSPWSLANRVSFVFDFKGPSMPVDTACSSSLTALHLACESLRKGECDFAIAGGVNLYLHPAKYVGMCTLEMLSHAGKCRAFGEGSDGFVPGEGVGAVLLRPLQDAERSGDHIYGIIRGSAINHGGRTNGYTVPDPNAQARVVLDALSIGGVDPASISYVEAHGTGTPLGDPIEVVGLTKAFRTSTTATQYCPIGSVKPNIGHLESAAGIAGVTKTLLQLVHKQLVPSLYASRPNPDINLQDSPFYVQQELAAWLQPVVKEGDSQRAIPRRAGVSSFGAGGANAHVVLEEYTPPQQDSADTCEVSPYLVVLSAREQELLQVYAGKLLLTLEREGAGVCMRDLAYTLQVGREAMDARLALVVKDHQDLQGKLSEYCRKGYVTGPGYFAGSIRNSAVERSIGDSEKLSLAGLPQHLKCTSLAACWVRGSEVDWTLLYASQSPRRISLPTYPFAEERYWIRQSNAATSPISTTAESVGPQTKYHEIVWMSSDMERIARVSSIGGRLLILNPRGVDLTALKTKLEVAHGGLVQIVLVNHGTSFLQLNERELETSLNREEGLLKLAEWLNSRDRSSPIQVLLLLPGRASAGVSIGECAAQRAALEDGVHLVHRLLRALHQQCALRQLKQILCFSCGNASQVDPFTACLSGFCRSLAFVAPGARFRTVSIEDPMSESDRDDLIVGECLREAEASDTEIRWLSGKRQVKRSRPFALSPTREVCLRNGGVYLITGGCGALGLIFARHLIEEYQASVVLTGRSASSPRMLQYLESHPSSAPSMTYLQADAADLQAMQGVIRSIKGRFGALNGVIHAAGTNNQQLITEKDSTALTETLRPKIEGSIVLDEVTKTEKLDFFVLFSSVASILGDFGQCDYAIANRFLDSFSSWRELLRDQNMRSGQTIAINWPLWQDGGMHLEQAGESLYLKSYRTELLKSDAGLRAFREILASGVHQVLVQAGAHQEQTRARDVDSGMNAERTVERLEEEIRRIAGGVINYDPSKIDVAENLSSYGFDSLSLREFAARLSDVFALEISPTLFFRRSTIGALAQHLLEEHEDELRRHYIDRGAEGNAEPCQGSAMAPERKPSSESVSECPILPTGAVTRDERDIAIIGAEGVFPGSRNLAEFWRNLECAKDLITEVPSERWDWRKFQVDSGGGTGAGAMRWGGFVPDAEGFDAKFFNISAREAELMDPQNRLLLQVIWKAIEDAGYRISDLSGRAVGVFVGVQFSDYRDLLATAGSSSAQVGTGNSHAMLSNRVSYLFDLRGPSESIDTACSSSLTAVNRAVRAIQNGECLLAVVGGVSLVLSPQNMMSAAQLGIVSPSGRCRTFDKSADGYVKGEGVGAIVLKPLRTALQDHDHIYAVIRGTKVNHGGKASSLTAPNPEAQAALIVAAHEEAGFSSESVTYVETHGTGTPLGDPVEFEGLKSAFRQLASKSEPAGSSVPYCGLGSVKTNIGHLEPASGIAGLLKVVLAMKHETLPATLHLEEPNPLIDLRGTPFYLVSRTSPWRRRVDEAGNDVPLRAGVSSFGFGGANAHVALEEYRGPRGSSTQTRRAELVVLSARTEERLRRYAQELADFLGQTTQRPLLEERDGSAHVMRALVRIAAEVLNVNESSIGVQEPLSEYGFDLGRLMEFARRIGVELGLQTTPQLLSSQPSIRALAEYAVRQDGGGYCRDSSVCSDVALVDLAYTLQVGREAMGERLAVLACDTLELVERLRRYCAGAVNQKVFRGTVRKRATSHTGQGETRLEGTMTRAPLDEKELAELAEMWVSGANIDWAQLYGKPLPYRISLPSYPFASTRYWIPEGEKGGATESVGTGTSSHPPLLRSIGTHHEREFVAQFSGRELWLVDHVVSGHKTLPAVFELELALTAGEMAGMRRVGEIRELVWARPIQVADDSKRVLVKLRPVENGMWFCLKTDEEPSGSVPNVQGVLIERSAAETEAKTGEPALEVEAIKARCSYRMVGADCYRAFESAGLEYGPSFRAIQELHCSKTEALSRIELPEVGAVEADDYMLHPALMDAALQSVIGLRSDPEAGIGLCLPFTLEQLEVVDRLPRACYVHATYASGSTGNLGGLRHFNVDIADESGRIVVRLRNLATKQVNPEGFGAVVRATVTGEPAYWVEGWEQQPVLDRCSFESWRGARVLLFDESEVLRDTLREQLVTQGKDPASVYWVRRGKAYRKCENQIYEVEPGVKGDFEELVLDLVREGGVPECIIWRWGSAEDASCDQWDIERSIRCGLQASVYSWVYLSQMLMVHAPGESFTLLHVYGRNIDIAMYHHPLNGAINGVARTLCLENRRFVCRSVEIRDEHLWNLESVGARRELVDIVRYELELGTGAAVRWQGGCRWSSRLNEVTKEDYRRTPRPLRIGGVYVITGGLGGLGMLLAQHFCQQRVHLVLVGRSVLVPEKWQQIAELCKQGADVEYLQADVSVAAQVRALVSQVKRRYGRIDGVFHCAGVTSDATIRQKTGAEIDAVLAPKVVGTVNLDQATVGDNLDFLVLFSSTASVLGNPGQGDYAYANSFLDHFARAREVARAAGQRQGRTVAINWSLWQDGGMRVSEQTLTMMARELGMRPLSRSAGLEALEYALSHDCSQLIVIDADRDRIREVAGAMEKGTTGDELPQPPIKLDEKLRSQLCRELAEIVVGILKVPAADIDFSEDLESYGFDSITYTEFANKISDVLRVRVTPAIFFELVPATLDALAQYLEENFVAALQRRFRGTAERRAPVAIQVKARTEFEDVARNSRCGQSKLQEPHMASNDESDSCRVAVIGMSGAMPQSKDLRVFWNHLQRGEDLIGEVPSWRWDWRSLGGADDRARWGGFMDDVDKFDPGFFGISAREAESMDPQQRVFLEAVWRTIEDAGYKASELSGKKVGVYVGAGTTDYYEIWRGQGVPVEAYAATGMAHSILANRVSFLLNLRGPSESIDTACSSSLVAIHRAVESIRNGSCELAVAGGVNVLLSPTLFQVFGAAGMLSPDGRCKTFDRQANGYTRGEGVGAVLLKPLRRAELDGDHIYAVIIGSAVNHGGHSASLTAPNAHAQAEVIMEACQRARVPVDTIGYIETHGTGTALGDPVELNGLKKAFTQLYQRQGKSLPSAPSCGIGSVKTNIGHLEAAAGMAGLFKVLLALQHRELPASLHFRELNPHAELQDSPFYVVKETQEWESMTDEQGRSIPRRAGISSFGFGGTNAHIVVEEWKGRHAVKREKGNSSRRREGLSTQLIVLSAKSELQLKQQAHQLAEFLKEATGASTGLELDAIAYTLQVGREAMDRRLVVPVSTIAELVERLDAYHRGEVSAGKLRTADTSKGNTSLASLLDDELKGQLTRMMVDGGDWERLAQLWLSGFDVDWRQLYREGVPSRVSLPGYPFERKRYWFDSFRAHTSSGRAPLSRSVRAPEELQDVAMESRTSAGWQLEGQARQRAVETPEERAAETGTSGSQIKGRVLRTLAGILHTEESQIVHDVPLREFGLDSIGTLEFVNAIGSELHVAVTTNEIYDFPTVNQLTEHLLTRIKVSEQSGTKHEVPVQSSVQAVEHAPRLTLKRIGATSGGCCATLDDHSQSDRAGDIAIIGISGVFPGASNLQEFWDKLKQGADCITEVPPSRWDVNLYYDSDPHAPNKTYCKWGGFINAVDRFDPLFFRLSPAEAALMDPQQRLFLLESVRALEDAGYADVSLSGTKCGVYVGVSNNNDYATLMQESLPTEDLGHAMLGGANSILASRISYFLNLKGPAIALDTACSSSLVAIHLACRAIQANDIEMALAGGVLLQLHPKRFILTSKSGALSPTGRCHTFDSRADGYVPGEGVGVIVLKALNAAMRDNDHIYGVIRGSGVNQDGTTNGITAPSVASQSQLQLDVYARHNIDPSSITLVEAHGTGTKLGDPIEVAALTQAFRHYTDRKQYCALGSVKTNIGHLAAAAGVASVIKVLLCLKHRQIPPVLHYRRANEQIRFEDTPFTVNTELEEWPNLNGTPRRAAVSAFGLSGTNCHLIIEEPPPTRTCEERESVPWFLVTLSAKNSESLNQKRLDLAAWLEQDGKQHRLADVSFGLLVGRSAYSCRWAAVVSSHGELLADLRAHGAKLTPRSGEWEPSPGTSAAEAGARTLQELAQCSVRTTAETERYRERLLFLARIYLDGTDLDWSALFKNIETRRISLPTYPFSCRPIWLRTGAQGEAHSERSASMHPLIDADVSDGVEKRFRVRLRGDEFFLVDHVIGDDKVFPAVAYVEAARAAAEIAQQRKVSKLKNVVFAQPIRVDGKVKDVVIELCPGQRGTTFRVATTDQAGCTIEHAQGTIVYHDADPDRSPSDSQRPLIDITAVRKRCSDNLSPAEIYRMFRQVGVNYGSSFQTIRSLHFNEDEALALLQLPADLVSGLGNFVLHPSLIDGLLQTTVGIALGDKTRTPDVNYLPFVVSEIQIMRSVASTTCYGYAKRSGNGQRNGAEVMKFDIHLVDDKGTELVRLREFAVRAVRVPGPSPTAVAGAAFYRPEWQPSDLASRPSGAMHGTNVVVFDSGGGLPAALQRVLTAEGDDAPRVVTVRPGKEYRETGNHSYEIEPGSEEDYRRVVASLVQKRLLPNGSIIHAWSRAELMPRGENLAELLESGVYSLVRLLRALIGAGCKEGVRLAYVYPASDEYGQPQYAAVSGLARSVIRECPELSLRTLEIETGPASDDSSKELEWATAIATELAGDERMEVRWKGKERYSRCLVPVDLEGEVTAACGATVRENSVVIITGGGGGLGHLFACHLAKTRRCRLVLVGRTQLDQRISARLQQIQDVGGHAVYIDADVSSPRDVEKVVSATKHQFGQIDGVIHCAGEIRDGYVHQKSIEDMRAILAPKVWGAVHLDDALKDEHLEFFVCFSAIAPIWGNPGQATYAYANAFVDHFCQRRERFRARGERHGRSLSINWPLWRDGGMRLDDRIVNMLTSLGLVPLPTDVGIDAWEKGMAAAFTQLVVTYGDGKKLERLHASLAFNREAHVRRQPPVAAQPSSSRPILDEEACTLRVGNELREIVAQQLRLDEESIDPKHNLRDYGYDSINLTILANRINQTFAIEISPATFFELESLTVQSCARYLMKAHGQQIADRYQSTRASTGVDACGRPGGVAVVTNSRGEPPGAREAPPGRDRATREPPRAPAAVASQCEPVAIIGMNGRFPRCDDLEDFWDALACGGDLTTEIPPERWDWRAYEGDPLADGNGTRAKWGGFMTQVDAFDARFFDISPREAELMDPQQRILLETVWKTLEDAGYKASDLAGSRTGLYLGISSSDYSHLLMECGTSVQAQAATGLSHSIAANRISYLLDLHGPCEAINTACSSSLVAVCRAVEAIRAGQCSMAIAGGVNVILSPLAHVAFGKLGVLSEDGRCRAFDQDANGIVRGEGVGTVLLKPLSQAVIDGDRICAVIKGAVENHGGRSSSLTAPNPNAQTQLIIDAYEQAQIEPSSLGYVECHGTGTRLGDPIEVNALKHAFRALSSNWEESALQGNRCGIGSVKTNIGHLEAAAGIASLLKLLLALKHQKLPATTHFRRLNPYIEIANTPLHVVETTCHWPRKTDPSGQELPRRAGVSSFGLGGTNVHLVLEEYAESQVTSSASDAATEQVVVLSARDSAALTRTAEKMRHFLERTAERRATSEAGGVMGEVRLIDIAYTLQVGREPMAERMAIVCSSLEELRDQLERFCQGGAHVSGVHRGRAEGSKTDLGALTEGPAGVEFVRNLARGGELARLAALWVMGVEVDWNLVYRAERGRRISLPTYPFSKDRYWLPSATRASEPRSAQNVMVTSATDPLRDLFFIPRWRRIVGASSGQASVAMQHRASGSDSHKAVRRSVLLIYPDSAQQIAQGLREEHSLDDIIEIKLGSQTRRRSERSWEVNVHESQSLATCIASIGKIDALYFLGEVPAWSPDEPSVEELDQCQARGVFSLFRTLKALAQNDRLRPPLELRVITNNVCKVLPEDRVNPNAASLLGFVRSIAKEYPSIEVSCLDLESAVPGQRSDGSSEDCAKIVRTILAESGKAGGDIIAIRNGERYRQELEPTQLPPTDRPPFRHGGVYLVIGGAGGIGLEVSRFLVKLVEARIVLLGRSPLSKALSERISDLDVPHDNLVYVQADVADPESMNAAIRQVRAKFGVIHGAIHSAAVLEDGTLDSMNEETLQKVLASKVRGSLVLYKALREEKLDFMLLFSSAASLSANAGRSGYAAGCAFIDAFAHYLKDREAWSVKVINWGYWGGVGLARDKVWEERFAARGVQPIAPEEGTEAISRILSCEASQVVAVKRTNGRTPEYCESKHRLYPGERTQRDQLVEILSQVLRVSPSQIATETQFARLGVDSVLAIEIVHRINTEMRAHLRSTDLFNYPTVEALLTQLNRDAQPPSGMSDRTVRQGGDTESTSASSRAEVTRRLLTDVKEGRRDIKTVSRELRAVWE